jgi:undecaprenyl-diphosphatase
VLLVPLALISLLLGVAAAAIVLRWPSVDPASPRVVRHTAHEIEHALLEQRGFRRFVAQRTRPEVATGLLLTVALIVTIVGGFVLGVLAVLVRGDSAIVSLDRDVSRWVADHGSQIAHDVLQVITQLGATEVVIVAAVVVLVVEYRRRPSHWIAPFLAVVLIGQSLLSNGIKELLDRVRPALNPAAHLLGPSFPSGHTATAAAFWAAVALLMGRGRGRHAHAALAGGAVAIASAVACTRVLLDLHWLSDVIAGLALGWAWFALSSIAFGGRLLRFGAPVEAAERALTTAGVSVPARSAHAPGTPVGIEHQGVTEVEERAREA